MTSLLSWMLLGGCTSFVLSVFFKHIALKFGIVDTPNKPRKIHKGPIALLGGAAIYTSLLIVVALALVLAPVLTSGAISHQHYIGVLIGGAILILGGLIDDRFELPPRITIWFPVSAALVTVVFGIEVTKLTNPLGGVIEITPWISHLMVFLWLMCVMYTTKFLDGLDGLATSVSGVGTFMILLLSLTAAYAQPDVALFTAIILGTFCGFLFWNLYPARIFLGEGGSTLVGYMLGTLAIISGGKLATALLVIGIPLLDVVWVIVRRYRSGGFKQIVKGDRTHLHHRLFDRGWSQRRVLLFYVVIASVFGVTTLFLQSNEKLLALILLGGIMLLTAAWLRATSYETSS